MKVVAFLLIYGLCHAQTLQRRTSPPGLQPISCRDHVVKTRHEFKDLADLVKGDEGKSLMGLYESTGIEKQVLALCENDRLASLYDVELADAIYAHAVILEDAAKGKPNVDEPSGKLP